MNCILTVKQHYTTRQQVKNQNLMQEKKLQEAVCCILINEHSPFYKELFTKAQFNV